MEKVKFDYEVFNKQLIEDIRSGKSLISKDCIFTPLITIWRWKVS